MKGLKIRQMAQEELVIAAGFTAVEGWVSEDLTAFHGFYQHDPSGCLLASLDGLPVGICIATCYGMSGFIGELIVHPTVRGKGIGATLLDTGIHYLQNQGVKTIYLDGVLKAVSLYERHGFRKLCRSLRFSGRVTGNTHPSIRPMEFQDLPQVYALDQQAFGSDRSDFLSHRYAHSPNLCRVLIEEGKLCGFILGRQVADRVVVGPWVVTESDETPQRLLENLACGFNDLPIHLGTLESNCRAVEVLNSLGFKERSDSPWRMALGPGESLGASEMCFAIGSAAKG